MRLWRGVIFINDSHIEGIMNKSHLLGITLWGAAVFFLVLCSGTAQAVDFKVSGEAAFGFEVSNVLPRHGRNTNNDTYNVMQRFRLQLQAIANEWLSSVVQVELGSTDWGKAANGGSLGTDGTKVKVRFAYVDWMIPNTEIKTRMGLQTIMLPGVMSQYGFSPVFGKEMAGITASSPIYHSDELGIDATAFWARPYNDNATDPDHTNLDNMDVFALVVPVTTSNVTIKPYVMYSLIGKYSLTNLNAAIGDNGMVAPRGGLMPVLGGNHTYAYFQDRYVSDLNKDRGDGIWAGLVGDIKVTDDLRLGFEGVYGSVDMGSVKNYKGFDQDAEGRTFDVRRAGWYVGARLDYAFDWGVPGILVWYGSGDDGNPYNGSERLPQYNTPWAVSSLGYGGSIFDEFAWKVLGHNPGGSIGVIAQLDKLSFWEKLKHTLRVGYYLGTNSSAMPRNANMQWPTRADGPNAYLTTKDDAWEVNFITHYKLYENVTISLDAAYLRVNLDSDVWRGAEKGLWKNNYHIGTCFIYNF